MMYLLGQSFLFNKLAVTDRNDVECDGTGYSRYGAKCVLTARSVSRICRHMRRLSADLFQTERRSS